MKANTRPNTTTKGCTRYMASLNVGETGGGSQPEAHSDKRNALRTKMKNQHSTWQRLVKRSLYLKQRVNIGQEVAKY